MDNDPIPLIKAALPEIAALMADAYSRAEPLAPDHALSQGGLSNGHEIVLDHIDHNEAGIAFEHLIYMVSEPPLAISNRCYQLIVAAGKALGVQPAAWRDVRTRDPTGC